MQNVTKISDGFEDYDEDREGGIIKGAGKIKYTVENEWVVRDEVLPPDDEFLAIEILKVLQKWLPGSVGPVETQILAADEKFPDVEALNEKAPRSEWQEVFGKKRGPYQAAMVVYLLNQQTMQLFTFVTVSVGGFRAVRELRDSTRLARKVRGAAVFPVVSLTDTFMPTRYGGRQRPYFKILRFVPLGEQEVAPRQIGITGPVLIDGKAEAAPKPKKPKAAQPAKGTAKAKPELDDEDPELDEAGEDEAFFTDNPED